MLHVDYTHPDKVPHLYLPHDRRSPDYYLRLDELPPSHRLHSIDWALFRYPEWLDGGSAWVQAQAIFKDLMKYGQDTGLMNEFVRPVVGSADPAFDEALAQSLRIMGLAPLVAEVVPRNIEAAETAAMED